METNDLISKLSKLVYLDIDTVHAYAHTFKNMRRQVILQDIKQLQADHISHIDILNREITKLGGIPAARIKGSTVYMIEGIASLPNNESIEHKLKAMKVNEILTNINYKKILEEKELPTMIRALLKDIYNDEKRHLQFIEKAIHHRSWIK